MTCTHLVKGRKCAYCEANICHECGFASILDWHLLLCEKCIEAELDTYEQSEEFKSMPEFDE